MSAENRFATGSEWSRRDFFRIGLVASAGLTLAAFVPTESFAESVPAATPKPGAGFAPSAFVRIAEDSTVTVICKHTEMGQGTYTGLPTIVAEELDADWAQVRAEGAPANPKLYNNLSWGQAQGTGGSSSIANSYAQLRHAGATARAMLVAAAAKLWSVPADSITVAKGVVSHKASGKKVSFGSLAKLAATLPVPTEVRLKDPKQFVFIGKRVSRTDSVAKTNGSAIYTQDLKLPGMLTAVVAHPPRFGAKVKSFDPARAKAVAGVVAVVGIPSGVAVVAKDFWSAKKGRDALTVDWEESQAVKASSTELTTQYRALAQTPGAVARKDGEVTAALGKAAKRVEAEFEFPYLSHASMEPLNCVVQLGKDGCEVWNGEQNQTGDQFAISKVLGLRPDQVKLNQLFVGGSFGRRANPQSDYVLEAVFIAKALSTSATAGAPVKLLWTREDDMQGGYYRPMYVHKVSAGLDAQGKPVAWQQRIVGQSIAAGTAFEPMMVKNGVDGTSVEGAANLPYAIPNLQVELHSPRSGIPVQWWRSVGSTHTAFSAETIMDELATLAGKDPVAFRTELLDKHPRHQGVLKLAADKAGWGKPLPAGKAGERRGRGVALHESFHSVVAQVAEVTVAADGSFHVDRVVCAVDCGLAVNPDQVAAQMEGGIGYGLSAALSGAITVTQGAVDQSNFHDYPVLRMPEMPKVEVHIVPSTENPSGVGEPGVPVIAPAVANALFAATGKRLRKLPFVTADLKSA